MFETGSPPPLLSREDEALATEPPLSPPPTSCQASRSSTPGISSLDGTPRYLFPLLPPPVDRPSAPAPMISPPLPLPEHGTLVARCCEPMETLPMPAPKVVTSPPPPPPRPAVAPLTKTTTDSQDSSRTQVPTLSEAARPIGSLVEISRLLRLQRYHQRRSLVAQAKLGRLQVAAARTVRLACAARSVQQTFAECIRLEDRTSFANLLNAFHDAADACLSPDDSGSLEMEDLSPGSAGPAASFIDGLSLPSQTAILELLSKLRYDGSFLANRLDSLTQREILALLPDRTKSRSNESIVSGPNRNSARFSRPMGFLVDSQVELLASQGFGSPLETLICAPRSIIKSDPVRETQSTEIWAQVCAQLIVNQKPGSEKLVPAIFDIFAGQSAWSGKERLEMWILQTLQRGSFILEPPDKQTFAAWMGGREGAASNSEARLELFFTKAVESLLDLLADSTGASVIPPGALRLSHAISHALHERPRHQHAFPQFVLKQWLLPSFLVDAITLPEAFGLLTDHYISEPARHRILLEVAKRAQTIAFAVIYNSSRENVVDRSGYASWKFGNATTPEMTARMQAVLNRFQPIKPTIESASTSGSDRTSSDAVVAVTVADVVTIVNALYPQRRPPSVSSDQDNLKSGLQSSASSVSGFSLFNNAKFSDSVDMNASWAPEQQAHLSVEGVTNGAVDPDEISPGNASIRVACIELDELAANRIPSSRQHWDVLMSRSGSQDLQTLQSSSSSSFESVTHRQLALHTSDATHNLPGKSLHQFLLARKAIEAILLLVSDNDSSLCDREITTAFDIHAQLQSLFVDAMENDRDNSDYIGAHAWYCRLQEFLAFAPDANDGEALRRLLSDISGTARRSTQYSQRLEASIEESACILRPLNQLRSEVIRPIAKVNERLRDKMWYVADVRPTAHYHEARSIATALRIMGKPKLGPKARQDPPPRPWSSSRMPTASLHLKSDAQILDILSAKPDHGGPNKLSDDQARLTSMWMERQGIDNLCRGEERLHKLCMEIRKCIDNVVANHPSENNASGASSLFARDGQSSRQTIAQHKTPSLFASQQSLAGTARLLSLHNNTRSLDAMSNASQTLSSMSSHDYLESRSPTLATRSSIFSPAGTEAMSTSSVTSIGSSQTHFAYATSPVKRAGESTVLQQSSIDRLRERVTSLLLSDLTMTLFNDGSETDRAFWTGLGVDLIDKHIRTSNGLLQGSTVPKSIYNHSPNHALASFDYESAFTKILQRFSAFANPATKLTCLYEIDRLLVPYMAERSEVGGANGAHDASAPGQDIQEPNAKNTSEVNVRGFRTIFAQRSLRPATIFRDLQYIAALTPSSVLQNTAPGKAFCNAAVALMSLKNEARTIMVETADSIIAYHSNNRGHEQASSLAQQQRDSATFSTPSRMSPAEDVARYSMADAGYLLQITAKEGDSVAQRELATLYLTHPDLMDHIIAPFARPRDVFKEELESKWRRNQDPTRCHPTTMCVAHHWMSLSSRGGDALAKEYLRQREEMDSF